jgi:hypothetical protein
VTGLAARLIASLLAVAPAPAPGARVVPREEILAAMQARKGYDPAATTNGARFQAEVLLDLLRASLTREPEGGFLFFSHEDWFRAYAERLGRTAEEAPLFMRLSWQHGQDMEVDARAGRVIDRVLEGPPPLVAANVRIGWPESRGGPSRYSYEDHLSIPKLRVTNERMITYRLLDFGDRVAYEEVEGLRGRPIEGFLGLLFDLMGEGHVLWSRMTVSPDGLQINHARAGKGPFRIESTITVFPDGRVQKDLPSERADLPALEERLLRPVRIRFLPMDREHAPGEGR